LPATQMTLMKDLGKPLPVKKAGKKTELPIGERRFVQLHGVTRQEAMIAFQNATILST